MSVKDEKLNELAQLLGFDTGLAKVMYQAQADTPVEEIQTMIDDTRALRTEIAEVLEAAPQEIKDGVARLRAL